MNRTQIILNYILNKAGKINHYKLDDLKNNHPNCYDYLVNYYNNSSCIEETINRIKYNVIVRPVCKYCGGYVKWYGKNNYAAHCCTRCSSLDKNVQEKTHKTCLERYNAEIITQSEYFKEKSKITCNTKYGVDFFTQSNQQKEKSKITKQIKYNSSSYNNPNKAKQTKKELYGDEHYNNREKAKQTIIDKYGVNNSYRISYIVKKATSKESQIKRRNTLKINNHINTSLIEDNYYNYLIQYYPDIIRQYTDNLYPFNCDFYIPSKKLYIEIQGGHYHQYHPFNPNDENDNNKLNEFINKQYLPQYKQIINIWTKRDPLKRKTAKENNLNFIEVWPSDNIEDILQKIEGY